MKNDYCDELIAALPTIQNSGSRRLLSLEIFRELASLLKQNPKIEQHLANLVAVQCIFFQKSLSRNWAVGLHRDTVVPIEGTGPWKPAGVKEGMQAASPSRVFLDACVAVRVQLDGAPVEDISVVPGSHLDASRHKPDEAIPLAIPRGGVLLMRPTLVHGSSRLRDTKQRRVLHYLFAPMRIPDSYRWYYAL